MLRLAGEHGGDFSELRMRFVMTRAPQVISPDDDVVAAAELMATRRIRHLPIAQDGNVVGILGIRDVMRCLLEAVWRDHDPRRARPRASSSPAAGQARRRPLAKLRASRACSSAGERPPHTREVAGSSPATPNARAALPRRTAPLHGGNGRFPPWAPFPELDPRCARVKAAAMSAVIAAF